MGTPSNLHRIWDSGMINTGHQDLLAGKHGLEEQGVAYANDLFRRLGRFPVDTKMNVDRWLHESLALRRPCYDRIYETDQTRYQNLHLHEVDERIYASGLRLAELINEIYSGEPVPREQVDLWKDIEAIVGDLDRLISLRP
jgi:hypothetical protein